MRFHERIRTIYWKELIDILRDHRTLIAMIVVPIVLYPLLMLGSIQAVSYQGETQRREQVRIGVMSEFHGHSLHRLIQQDAIELKGEAHADDVDEANGAVASGAREPLENFEILQVSSRDVLAQRIADRSIHVGVILRDTDRLQDAPETTNEIDLLVDAEDIRSIHARAQLERVFERTRDRTVAKRKARAGLPQAFDEPFAITVTDLSSPPSILGQVLPLILILMTITGAIYPAIDVTAGERERGTLESLMVSPVRVYELVVGKFLVVTTVAVMGAALNLASVTATVYFGGFRKVVATDTGLPLATMLVILLCLIPFAVLMSAIMIAVCCFARTFKEAQNYVTPVILAVLIPGGLAALPTTRLDGVMLVMPVGNMVLLARELLLGAAVPVWHIVFVLVSTSLYAGSAVAIAASLFGRESVVFADAGSLRAALSRRLVKAARVPSISTGLLVTALLFPAWFFIQASNTPRPGQGAFGLLAVSAYMMPVMFVLIPAAVVWYWKIDLRHTFQLQMPAARYWLGAAMIGVSAFVPAHLVNTLQREWIGMPDSVLESVAQLTETIRQLPTPTVILILALIPAVCEEWLFRGFLLSSLRNTWGKWASIIVAAAIFGVFHFILFRFPVTVGLGVVLGYLCVQSKSILPCIVVHAIHNSMGVLSAMYPGVYQSVGVGSDGGIAGLSIGTALVGIAVFVAGLLMVRGRRQTEVRTLE